MASEYMISEVFGKLARTARGLLFVLVRIPPAYKQLACSSETNPYGH